MCDIFSFFEFCDIFSFFGRKTKATDQSFSFLKIFLFHDNKIEITCKNQSIYQITVALKITFKQF